MTTHTKTLPRLTLALAAVALTAVAMPSLASAECRLDSHTTKTTTFGAECSVTRHTASYSDPVNGQSIDVQGDTLTCGNLDIDRWSTAKRAAVQACNSADKAHHLKLAETLEVPGFWGDFVTVRQTSVGGITETPYADLEVMVFDTETGEVVTLQEILPYHFTDMERLARAQSVGDFTFEPDAFYISGVGTDSPMITFIEPGTGISTVGTTRTYDLFLPIGISPRVHSQAREDFMRYGSERERVRKAACTRVGNYLC